MAKAKNVAGSALLFATAFLAGCSATPAGKLFRESDVLDQQRMIDEADGAFFEAALARAKYVFNRDILTETWEGRTYTSKELAEKIVDVAEQFKGMTNKEFTKALEHARNFDVEKTAALATIRERLSLIRANRENLLENKPGEKKLIALNDKKISELEKEEAKLQKEVFNNKKKLKDLKLLRDELNPYIKALRERALKRITNPLERRIINERYSDLKATSRSPPTSVLRRTTPYTARSRLGGPRQRRA